MTGIDIFESFIESLPALEEKNPTPTRRIPFGPDTLPLLSDREVMAKIIECINTYPYRFTTAQGPTFNAICMELGAKKWRQRIRMLLEKIKEQNIAQPTIFSNQEERWYMIKKEENKE